MCPKQNHFRGKCSLSKKRTNYRLWHHYMFQKKKKRKEMESSVVGACIVQSSVIFPESQTLSVVVNLTPISLLGPLIKCRCSSLC